MADAAEAAVAGSDLRLQHARHAVADAQVGVPDNAGAQPALAELSARAHRRRAVDEFDFADRLLLRRPVGAVHRAAFDKDCLRDVVTAAEVPTAPGHLISALFVGAPADRQDAAGLAGRLVLTCLREGLS